MLQGQRFALGLSLLNVALLLLIALGRVPPALGFQAGVPVLRGRALEIVDETGRIRASITIQPHTSVNSRPYPETVLLRLIDPKSGPVVKLTAAANGAALGLSDDSIGGIQLFARDTGSFVRVTDRTGRAQLIRP